MRYYLPGTTGALAPFALDEVREIWCASPGINPDNLRTQVVKVTGPCFVNVGDEWGGDGLGFAAQPLSARVRG
ncbi:MAG: hypothetical protein O3C21_08855 [Verrucomicrobia bacterium]|nr:hypothetical protein [Verrucomicrobiota bacterium]